MQDNNRPPSIIGTHAICTISLTGHGGRGMIVSIPMTQPAMDRILDAVESAIIPGRAAVYTTERRRGTKRSMDE